LIGNGLPAAPQRMDEPSYIATETRRRHHYRGADRRSWFHVIVAVTLPLVTALSSAPSAAQAKPTVAPIVCPTVEAASRANALPVTFFVRLIWQESQFQPDAVGPETRSGGRALGIAQFMPGTAVEHQLFDPFDVMQAIAKSGEFLAQLRDEFGNLGLAAAAYNAGPQRVRDFLAGSRALPEETRNYVRAVTGRPVEEWKNSTSILTNGHDRSEEQAAISTNCPDLIASLENSSNSFSARRATLSEVRSVPSWCRDLRHPNISVCGSVHASEPTTAIARTEELQKRRRLARSTF
jgi:transglycosylase-like protein with SLT domain